MYAHRYIYVHVYVHVYVLRMYIYIYICYTHTYIYILSSRQQLQHADAVDAVDAAELFLIKINYIPVCLGVTAIRTNPEVEDCGGESPIGIRRSA